MYLVALKNDFRVREFTSRSLVADGPWLAGS